MQWWNEIPANRRIQYKGVTCRCQEEDGSLVGEKPVPSPWVDLSEVDAKYKYGYTYELWGMTRTDVLRQYPFPEPKGLHFFPEVVVWDAIGQQYLTRYVNTPLRIFYHDQENSTTKKGNSRFRENYYLWRHIINDLGEYHRLQLKMYVKAAIGIIRDGLLSGRALPAIVRDVYGATNKIAVIMCLPIGWILSGGVRIGVRMFSVEDR